MERKTFPAFTTKVDDVKGIVEAIVALTGNVDTGKDRIKSGAFVKTIAERGRKIRVLDAHNTDSIMRVIGKPLAMREVGQSELPNELLRQFPTAAGGLWTQTQYLLDTPEGKGAYIRIASGAVDEYSIGFDASDIEHKTEIVDGHQTTVRNIGTIRLWEYSPVLWGMNEGTRTLSAKDADMCVKGAVPVHTTAKAPEGEGWSRPTLSDFTDQQWGDLAQGERERIAGHFAYYSDLDSYGSLSLPHHRPSDGAVVWNGVAACAARMNQVQGMGDMAAVKAHLAAHYKQFDKPVPWEGEAKAFKAVDFDTTFMQQNDLRGLWEMRWKIDSAFDQTVESILADDHMNGASKLILIEESCQQYRQAMSAWSARAIAVGGKSSPEPLECKAGRRLSARSQANIRAAITALNDLLGEEQVAAAEEGEETAACDKPRKPKDEKSAPGPEGQAVNDSDSAEQAGPGTVPPTVEETKAAGPDVTPPTSEFEKQLAQQRAELEQFERQLEGITK